MFAESIYIIITMFYKDVLHDDYYIFTTDKRCAFSHVFNI